MKVMVMVKATADSEAGRMPTAELMEAMGKYNVELAQAGIMLDGAGLKPTSQGARVHFSGDKRTVIDGPFAETKELVAGYWVWEVKSLAEAIEWVKKCPNPMFEDSDIDIRPYYECDDFGDALTPEAAAAHTAAEAAIRARGSQIHTYLFFSGRCDEALEFYKSAVGAKVGVVMRYNQSPDPVPEGMLAAGYENKIMHCEFQVGETKLMASDGCGEVEKPCGFRLAMSVPTAADATRVFTALSGEGKVEMPLTPTFWSPSFGMLTDKFGVEWMVMVPPAEPVVSG